MIYNRRKSRSLAVNFVHLVTLWLFFIQIVFGGFLGNAFAQSPYSVAVSATVGGSTNPSVGVYYYDAGDYVTVKAFPDTGYSFLGWTENNTILTSNREYSFVVNRDRDIRAHFAKEQYTLTLFRTTGGHIVPDVGSYTYSYGDVVDLEAFADGRFSHWSGDVENVANVNSAKTNVVIEGDYSIQANFVGGASLLSDYTLTVSSAPGGSVVDPVTSESSHVSGALVTLQASAGGNYVFTHWGGDVSQVDDVNSDTTTVLLDGNYNIVANFALKVTGVVTTSGTPSGTPSFSFDPDGNVIIDQYTAEMFGSAWDDAHGWLNFDGVSIDKSTGVLVGTGTLLDTTKGVFFNDDDYTGAGVVVDLASGSFSGQAWTDDFGWLYFSGVNALAIEEKTLIYSAGEGGGLTGDLLQTVPFWGTGSAVTPDPEVGFYFLEWGDGKADDPRVDVSVIEDITVVASFEILFGVFIVDSNGDPASANLSFPDAGFSIDEQVSVVPLGSNDQRVRAIKSELQGSFNVVLSPVSLHWSDGSGNTYPYDSANSYEGLLEVDPSGAGISAIFGCDNTGIEKGSGSDFYLDSNITIITGDETTAINCQWDVTNIFLQQTIPAGVPVGEYTLELLLTMT